MDRNNLFEYIKDKYDTEPEYPWIKYPEHAVFRHRDNQKWFAVVMNVGRDKLSFESTEKTDIINLKADPCVIGSLITVKGILPGYHMNKKNWISVVLEDIENYDILYGLLETSYDITGTKKKIH